MSRGPVLFIYDLKAHCKLWRLYFTTVAAERYGSNHVTSGASARLVLLILRLLGTVAVKSYSLNWVVCHDDHGRPNPAPQARAAT